MTNSGVSLSRFTKKSQIVYSSKDFEKTGLTSVYEKISERESEEADGSRGPTEALAPTFGALDTGDDYYSPQVSGDSPKQSRKVLKKLQKQETKRDEKRKYKRMLDSKK